MIRAKLREYDERSHPELRDMFAAVHLKIDNQLEEEDATPRYAMHDRSREVIDRHRYCGDIDVETEKNRLLFA